LCRSVEPKMTEIWACNVKRHSVWNDSQTPHEHRSVIASGQRGHNCTIFTTRLRYFPNGSTSPMGHGLLIAQVPRSYSDTPHSVENLQKSDGPVTEISTWHRTTIKRGNIHGPGGIRTRNPSKQAAVDQRFSFEIMGIK
jgi:hypothetical protein